MDEIANLGVMIKYMVGCFALNLVVKQAIGYETAAQLLLTVGDNLKWVVGEALFAAKTTFNNSKKRVLLS